MRATHGMLATGVKTGIESGVRGGGAERDEGSAAKALLCASMKSRAESRSRRDCSHIHTHTHTHTQQQHTDRKHTQAESDTGRPCVQTASACIASTSCEHCPCLSVRIARPASRGNICAHLRVSVGDKAAPRAGANLKRHARTTDGREQRIVCLAPRPFNDHHLRHTRAHTRTHTHTHARRSHPRKVMRRRAGVFLSDRGPSADSCWRLSLCGASTQSRNSGL